MMRQILVFLLILINLNITTSVNADQQNAQVAEEVKFVVMPITKRGHKWRIGYIESNTRDTYYASLVATLQSLMKLGWLPQITLPHSEDQKSTTELWSWLATQVDSQYIEFVKDSYWTDVIEPPLAAKASTELLIHQKEKALDLMICMGTDAGLLIRAMSDNKQTPYTIPTIFGSVTDAVAAGIVNSAKHSGYDHLLAKVDPDRFKTQIQIFHNIFHFKKLGIVYDPEKSSISGFETIAEAALERGITLVSCHIQDRGSKDIPLSEQELTTCYETLAPKIDAMYVTSMPGLTTENMPDLLAPLYQYRIPSFVQLGSKFVKDGMLMTLSTAGYGYLGDYYAETIAKVFNGAKLGQLEQILPSRLTFTINLETARKINAKLPIEVVGAADEIYGLSENDF